MKLTIVWTPQAEKGLTKVIDYLKINWTEKEIINLRNNLLQLTNRISVFPKSCPSTKRHKHLFKGLIDKNNYLIYRINFSEKQIEIINFRGTKQQTLY